MTKLEQPLTAKREKLISKAILSLNQLPPFSPVFTKLLASLSNENVSVSELADWVEKDAIIAGQLLRTVNSAAYGRTSPINNLRHAVAFLGLTQLRNLCLGLSVSRMWTQIRTPQNWCTARFNLHSAACAIMADQIALHASVEFGEGAFAAGLLHDIGRIVIALGLPNEYDLVHHSHMKFVCPYWQSELKILGFNHAELGGLILQKWNLPIEIQQAVAAHHCLFVEQAATRSLVWVLEVADETVNRMGISILPAPTSPEAGPKDVIENGKAWLDAQGLEKLSSKILKTFQVEFDVMKALA